ncbi:MAG: tRNA 2-thiocytidine biosynthesis protein TtcA [Myxococcota bacterium]|jgi:tRNA 2-thiocytidine biosynthesis protein TtcA
MTQPIVDKGAAPPLTPEARRRKIEHKLLGHVMRCVRDFALIEPGDRVMACVSGGKDSYVMLHLLRELQRRLPFKFELFAVNLDQKQPNFPTEVLPTYMAKHGYTFHQLQRDTYSVVLKKVPANKTYCALCSRLRRGILYDAAVDLGATKIALGHHRDDLIETLLLNIFYSGQLKSMPPRLHSDDGRNVVIRPLAYCAEEHIAELSERMAFPIIPCDLCGTQENLQRKKMKQMLTEMSARNPKVKGNLLSALTNVKPSHLLDRDLWERLGMTTPTGHDETVI